MLCRARCGLRGDIAQLTINNTTLISLTFVAMTTFLLRFTHLLAAILALNGATGFVQENVAFFRSAPSIAFRSPTSSLSALVFGPDGTKMDDEDWGDMKEELVTLEQTGAPLGMSQVLTEEQKASLARMASAFAPPGQKLDITHINNIEILSVGSDRIEISAIVCETDGCVTARVPISFPTPCYLSDGLDQCITNNLAHLDEQAQGLIREMNLKEENREDDEYIWKVLTSTEGIDFPTWWETRPGMSEDCDSIRRLLNEEGFQAEIRAVATKALMDLVEHTETFKVQKTAVVAVCPSGIHMRALVKRTKAMGNEETTFMQVPLGFGQSANDGESLRDEVLRTVNAAAVYVE